MTNEKVKIVDTFNGGEFGSFDSYEEADNELTKMRTQFYAHKGNKNSWFCRVVAPADCEWVWSQSLNKFMWDR